MVKAENAAAQQLFQKHGMYITGIFASIHPCKVRKN